MSNKHGPLYEGIRLLIAEEKLNAETVWNETQVQIDENSDILDKALHYMQNYGTIINEKLDQINNLQHSDQVKKCYKKYERQIARFNRDLLQQYSICKLALNSSLDQLKSEIIDEMKSIHNAATEIQEVTYICNVTDLKKMSRANHHATVTICVISDLAEIKQKVLEATQVILRILARITIYSVEDFLGLTGADHIHFDMELKSNICLDFQYLRDEFETTYKSIMWCIDNEKY